MKPAERLHNDLFRMELKNLIGQRHELVCLSEAIDWDGTALDRIALYARCGISLSITREEIVTDFHPRTGF